MSALEDIRSVLKAALANVSKLNAYEVAPGQVHVPAAIVAPEGIEYVTDFDGGATYTFPIQFLASLGDWGTAQRTLDGYVGHDGSVVEAIHGADIEARVVRMEQYGLTTYGDTDYLGCQVVVEVIV